MRIACIIQARSGSTRLPNKINADIGGWPMLKHVVIRAGRIGADITVVATPEDYPEVDENDVLARYWAAANRYGADAIMRITGDCPLLDPGACSEVLEVFRKGPWDYVANDWKQLTRYPDGMGCEIFKKSVLRWAYERAQRDEDREHVTPWIIRQCREAFQGFHVACPYPDATRAKFSVDTQEDLERVRGIDRAKPADYSLAATLEAYERAKAQAHA